MVALVCDAGEKYLDSVFDDDWLRERELLDPEAEAEVEELLAEIAGTAPQRLHGPPRASRPGTGVSQRPSALGDRDVAVGPDGERAPAGEQLQQLVADDLAAPALEGADVRLR